MLDINTKQEVIESLQLSKDESCNAPDHHILTHARGLISIVLAAQEQLEVARQVLLTRREYIDGVVFQINDLTAQPTEVLEVTQ